ncbi:hypothetical protein ABZZ74_18280 [Streptomyces sp. NPDC006476]|uniref:hypothetical protein n=1 Tax=Streptomyces sp. NPDC006476 TaxID=3157175 RepID=UPI0033A7029F
MIWHCRDSAARRRPTPGFLLSGVVWLPRVGRERRWLLSVVLPCCALQRLLAEFGAAVPTASVVWLFVLVVLWPTLYEHRRARRRV